MQNWILRAVISVGLGVAIFYVLNPDLPNELLFAFSSTGEPTTENRAELSAPVAIDVVANPQMSIEVKETACKTDKDCVIVSTSCNQCCGIAAASRSAVALIQKRLEDCQKAYVGGQCKCMRQEAKAVCRKRNCVLKPNTN